MLPRFHDKVHGGGISHSGLRWVDFFSTNIYYNLDASIMHYNFFLNTFQNWSNDCMVDLTPEKNFQLGNINHHLWT